MSGGAKVGCFTVHWEIKNFSIFLSEGQRFLYAPHVKSISGKSKQWYLGLNYYSLHLSLSCSTSALEEQDSEKIEASIISSCSKIPCITLISSEKHNKKSVQKDEILGNKQAFLPEDTLTICCRICEETIETADIHIHTVLHQKNFSWKVEFFNSFDYGVNFFMVDDLSFESELKRKHKNNYILIIKNKPNLDAYIYFVEMQPSVLNYQAKVTYCSDQLWDIEIFANGRRVTSPVIQLECTLAVHRKCQDPPLSCVKRGKDMEATNTHSSSSLTEDLLHLYREPLHSDATLKADGKSFPVHKNILCTRSEVFRSMFEKQDMRESLLGIVDIDDIDSETVDLMLIFMYSDMLKEINWQEASALYYAADKYAILPLKERCSDILKVGLSVDNACSAVVLADKHSDQDLMKCVVNFIQEHIHVISSPDWEKLEKNYPLLTSKITREILLKK